MESILDLRVNISRPQLIRPNNVPPRLNLAAHQRGENLIRSNRILDLHLEQPPNRLIRRRFPRLLRIHLAQPL